MLILILVLGIILSILLILDFVTTERVIQLGGAELNPYAMSFAGNPKKHALVKISEIVGIFIVIFLVDLSKMTSELVYLICSIILVIGFLILIIYSLKVVIGNIKAINELKRRVCGLE